ncbi:MAG: hypothetical protein IT280_09200 [Ignavibacteria bacterium]|nr:hypothetical protein [Ignavibacteria bacterium]
MKYLKIILLITVISFSVNSYSQHDHHNMNTDDKTITPKDSLIMQNDSTKNKHHDMHHENSENVEHSGSVPMSHIYSLSLDMNRNGSGTAWLPDDAPMNGYMLHKNGWMIMFHGNIFLRYTSTDISKTGKYGASRWDAPNWLMGMAQRKAGLNGLIAFRVMISLDPVTESGNGYPLLFQSGETWKGKPLVNRQHPHDFFAEISTAYTHRINKDIDVTGYFGYPGEPALGPVAFMHRVSSLNNPDAPLSHHWQDASHITFGVATFGLRYNIFKLEGSAFNGSEPDEERWGFDKMKLNSYSWRLSVNPSRSLALQVSQGYIKSPEILEPGVDVTRTTASIIHAYNINSTQYINSTLAWGYNNKGHGHKEHSVLLESSMQINKLAVYGRYEFVQKDPDELSLSGFNHDTKFNINALTLGTNYKIFQFANTSLAAGIQGSIYFPPKELELYYGKNPASAQIYIKLYPVDM